MEQQVKQESYVMNDFATMMTQNLYYVDKTIFLPKHEKQPRDLFPMHPRQERHAHNKS